jgi:plasmid stabilization system protein ParE
MERNLVWTERASGDIEAIVRYIDFFSMTAAEARFVVLLIEKLRGSA